MVLFALLSLACGALAARFAALGGIGFGSQLRRGLFHKLQDFSFQKSGPIPYRISGNKADR